MGEIYRARDPRLGREIAIKVLPADLASDPERLRRFEREARAASALSHPNIITVYDVGTTDSVSYMAIELIDGKTLHDLLAPGPLPIRKLLDLAVQIADGLAAAHEAGIVHRDLKPLNVMVSRAGFVKILDFGLAKVQVAPAGATAHEGSETVPQPAQMPGTTAGVVLGTTGYMSPEQARGTPLDFRSDQFSFGAVLYEMATGRRAFAGSTPADTLSAILQQEAAPVERLRPDAPAPLRWIIDRCLAKSAQDRYSSTSDLAGELHTLRDRLSEVSASAPGSSPTPSRRTAVIVAGVGVLAVLAALRFLLPASRGPQPEPSFRRLTFRRGFVSRALFVPNSNAILYTAGWQGEPEKTYMTLPESNGISRPLDAEPQLPMAWSTDGSQVLVLLGAPLRMEAQAGRLAWWPVLGGIPRPALDNASWSDWAKKARFLVVVVDKGTERHLEVHDAEGRFRQTLFRTPGTISFVRVSADEKQVAFIHHPTMYDIAGEVRIASLDAADSRALTTIFTQCFGLAWNPRSSEVWFTGSPDSMTTTSLWSVTAFGKRRLVHSFVDVFILQDISSDGARCLLASRRYRVRMFVRRPGETPRDLTWFDWTYVSDISPDGRKVLFYDLGSAPGMSGSWVRPVEGGDAVRIGEGEVGKFSPDGKWIVALTPVRLGALQLILYPTGTGQSRQLTSSRANHLAPSFAGAHTILYVKAEAGKSEVWRIETDGTGEQSLGAEGCNLPMANPGGNSFVCVGGHDGHTLFLYPMKRGTGRKVYELSGTGRFRFAGWSDQGDRIFAVTSDRRVMTLDPQGQKISEDTIPLVDESFQSINTAAVGGGATVQAYSMANFSSDLYMASGLR